MAPHRIAIIVGSLRKDSINRKVAKSLCAFAGDKLDCEIVEIGDLPLYNQDYDSDSPEPFVRFRERIAAADGILFVTPEYNRGVPGVSRTRSTSAHGPMATASGTRSLRRSSAPRPAVLGASAPTISFARPACSSTCR